MIEELCVSRVVRRRVRGDVMGREWRRACNAGRVVAKRGRSVVEEGGRETG